MGSLVALVRDFFLRLRYKHWSKNAQRISSAVLGYFSELDSTLGRNVICSGIYIHAAFVFNSDLKHALIEIIVERVKFAGRSEREHSVNAVLNEVI